MPENATPEQIKAAWRTVARLLHPDHGGDPDRFREAHEAYEMLTDQIGRALYDTELWGSRQEG